MITNIVLHSVSAVLAVPTAVLTIECLASLLPARRRTAELPRPRVAVLIPAHNEEEGIVRTLESIGAALEPGDRVLVVADNCSDDTAAIARGVGAEVVERHSETQRGKGHALSFGVECLASDPPEVVVVVDADCVVERRALDLLARAAKAHQRPAQADYLLCPAPDCDMRAAVGAFAILIRNRIRPRGLARLGLPCQLTGSGMAFPWELLRDARPTGSHVVEDLVLGLDLTREGRPPLFVERAHVMSWLPTAAAAQSTQRRRWETGQLSTLVEQVPRLLLHGLRRASVPALSSALDLSVPPLSLHIALLSLGTLLGLLLPGATTAGLLFAAQLASIAFALGVLWWLEGRTLLPVSRAAAVPAYILWKIPIYLSFALRGRERVWIRTQR